MTARLREMEETAEWHDGRWPSPEEAPMGGRLSLESRFPSFEEAIDVADEIDVYKRQLLRRLPCPILVNRTIRHRASPPN